MRTRPKKRKGAAHCKDRARSHKPTLHSNGLTDSTKRESIQRWNDFFARAAIGRPRRQEIIRRRKEAA
jgi:hypothetical protein